MSQVNPDNGNEDQEDQVEKQAAEDDVAEKPGTSSVSHEREDELVDEWGKESFPGSDPPAHY